MNEAPLWLDEPELEPMFGQLWPEPLLLGVAGAVLVPGVVVGPGVVVDEPPAAQAAPAPIAATVAPRATR
jgi:hypothetical protein